MAEEITYVDFERVEFRVLPVHALRHAAKIGPCRPRAITRLRRGNGDFPRGIQILADKPAEMKPVLLIRERCQREFRRIAKQFRKRLAGYSDTEFDAVGVITIRVRQHVVLDEQLHFAAFRVQRFEIGAIFR